MKLRALTLADCNTRIAVPPEKNSYVMEWTPHHSLLSAELLACLKHWVSHDTHSAPQVRRHDLCFVTYSAFDRAFLNGLRIGAETSELVGTCTGARPDGNAMPAWTDRAVHLIEREHQHLRLVRHLAHRVNCHPVYLARRFRQDHGLAVSEYLRLVKVGVTFDLLVDSDLKISAMSDLVGFSGKATLYRNVHLVTGRPPGFWRELRGRGQQQRTPGPAAADTSDVVFTARNLPSRWVFE